MIFEAFTLGPLDNNCYIFGDVETKEIAIIDAPLNIEKVINYINSRGFGVKYIILTHTHFDHTDGLNTLRYEFPDAEVIMDKRDEIYNTGSIHAKTIHTPGHTQDGICVYIESEKKLFSGDTLFFETIGRADLPGGNLQQLISTIKENLLILPDDVAVYPGHGQPTTVGHEKKNNKYLT